MNDYSERTCIRCIVYGKVQGVFYRASARNQAQLLGIVGHAKNLPDGNVEVVACGQQLALENLKDWLQVGPDAAKVTNVECGPISELHCLNFKTL